MRPDLHDTHEGLIYAETYGEEGPALPRRALYLSVRRRTLTIGRQFRSEGRSLLRESTFSAGAYFCRHSSQGLRRKYV